MSSDKLLRDWFMLMWYACKCGHRERIWNSREAVTPFTLKCPSCGEGTMEHVDWHMDVYDPNYKPNLGQGVFINMTKERALMFAKRRMKSFDGTEYEKQGDERDRIINAMAESNYSEFGEGTSPDFIRWSEE